MLFFLYFDTSQLHKNLSLFLAYKNLKNLMGKFAIIQNSRSHLDHIDIGTHCMSVQNYDTIFWSRSSCRVLSLRLSMMRTDLCGCILEMQNFFFSMPLKKKSYSLQKHVIFQFT